MKCFVCKKRIPKREGHIYSIFRTKTGGFKYLRWCKNCGETKHDIIDKEYDRLNSIDQQYMSEQRKQYETNQSQHQP